MAGGVVTAWQDMTRDQFDDTARDVQAALLPAPDPCGTGDLFELLEDGAE